MNGTREAETESRERPTARLHAPALTSPGSAAGRARGRAKGDVCRVHTCVRTRSQPAGLAAIDRRSRCLGTRIDRAKFAIAPQ